MKANPNKFQFMILSPNSADDIELKWDENTTLKAARQLNASAKISKYLDPKSISIIYNSFIRSNFEYCPLVWHFCGKTNNNKLEKIHERSLRILQDTYELSHEELLNRNGLLAGLLPFYFYFSLSQVVDSECYIYIYIYHNSSGNVSENDIVEMADCKITPVYASLRMLKENAISWSFSHRYWMENNFDNVFLWSQLDVLSVSLF